MGTMFLALVTTAGLAQAPDSVPPVDTTRHSVPLEDIYFDTFQQPNRAVRLTDATPALITRLRDAIPPLHGPKYEPAREARWLRDDDVVLGYTSGDSAWAYPIRILNFHEIVNDVLDSVPVLVSYCPLCRSGVVFSRDVGGHVVTFGNTSALYESDMLMIDYQSGSYWWQIAGRAVVGPMTDTSLRVLASTTSSWKEWKRLHPDTLVLARATGYNRDYNDDPFTGYAARLNRGQFAFPVTRRPYRRLDPGTIVLTVRMGDVVHAYPIAEKGPKVVEDRVGAEAIVVFMDGAGGAAAFRAQLDERKLSFRVRAGALRDRGTNTRWDLDGRASEGPLAGSSLEQVASKTSFWFAVVASEPAVKVRHR